ncbi:MAG: hypothetical protein LBG48_05060 [Rickettsiales bacterium]|nr:hypothetical protein [Rickettsiales bacterium]
MLGVKAKSMSISTRVIFETQPVNLGIGKKMIGNFELESGKMIHYDYYKIFNVFPKIPCGNVWGYGYTFLIKKSFEDMGFIYLS